MTYEGVRRFLLIKGQPCNSITERRLYFESPCERPGNRERTPSTQQKLLLTSLSPPSRTNNQIRRQIRMPTRKPPPTPPHRQDHRPQTRNGERSGREFL